MESSLVPIYSFGYLSYCCWSSILKFLDLCLSPAWLSSPSPFSLFSIAYLNSPFSYLFTTVDVYLEHNTCVEELTHTLSHNEAHHRPSHSKDQLPMAPLTGEPQFKYDSDAITPCTLWYNNLGRDLCEHNRFMFGISPEDFHKWNLSVGLDCKPWNVKSYCVVSEGRLASFIATASKKKQLLAPRMLQRLLAPRPVLSPPALKLLSRQPLLLPLPLLRNWNKREGMNECYM